MWNIIAYTTGSFAFISLNFLYWIYTGLNGQITTHKISTE